MLKRSVLMTKTALVPIADGSEDIEAVTIIDVLRRAGMDVTVASAHDHLEIRAARDTRIIADALVSQCVGQEYDVIALPGGMPGAENLGTCEALMGLIEAQKAANRCFGAICAAPGVALAPRGFLDDYAATGHPNFQDALPDQSRVHERVVVDRNCVTSQGPGTALEFALALVEQVCGQETRDQVAAPMVLPAQ
jgi:4-methyl-5(b-hydroxyethyl)-thiazole monophosphate biosynthesis